MDGLSSTFPYLAPTMIMEADLVHLGKLAQLLVAGASVYLYTFRGIVPASNGGALVYTRSFHSNVDMVCLDLGQRLDRQFPFAI